MTCHPNEPLLDGSDHDAAATSGTVEPETNADVVEWMTPATARKRRDEFVPGVVDVIAHAVDAVEDVSGDS